MSECERIGFSKINNRFCDVAAQASGAGKFIYVELFHHAVRWTNSKCRLSLRGLAKKTGFNRSTISRNLAELEERGFIRIERRGQDTLKFEILGLEMSADQGFQYTLEFLKKIGIAVKAAIIDGCIKQPEWVHKAASGGCIKHPIKELSKEHSNSLSEREREGLKKGGYSDQQIDACLKYIQDKGRPGDGMKVFAPYHYLSKYMGFVLSALGAQPQARDPEREIERERKMAGFRRRSIAELEKSMARQVAFG